MRRHLVDGSIVIAGGKELAHGDRHKLIQAVVRRDIDDFILSFVIQDDLFADFAVQGNHHGFCFQLGVDPLQGGNGILAVLCQVGAGFRHFQDLRHAGFETIRGGRQNGLEVFHIIRIDGCVDQPQIAEVADFAVVHLVGPEVGILGQGFRIHEFFFIQLMQPFNAGAPAVLSAGELNLIVSINEVIVGIFRHTEGGELIPDGFRAKLCIGGGEGPFDAVRLHGAEQIGHFINGGRGSFAQLIQFLLVYIPGSGVVYVLCHEEPNIIGFSIAGGDGVACIVDVQAADVVGHDLLGEILIQRKQKALAYAVFLDIHRVADDHIGHLVRYGEHQVDIGCPVSVLYHLDGDMGVGLRFHYFVEEPEAVEIGVLVFQRVLEGGQLHLVFSEGGAQAEQHAACQQQGNEFLHMGTLLFIQGLWPLNTLLSLQ